MPLLNLARATVRAIVRADATCVELLAVRDGEAEPRAAVAYPALSGAVAVGDSVVLNVTATTLRLGTGGVDFVVRNETHSLPETLGEPVGGEHIVKLRYTPLQHAVQAAEMDPRYAAIWKSATDLQQTPIVVASLHSQIAPVAAGVKVARPHARVAYIMTDAAALPLGFSRLVRDLKNAKLIDATLTAGQAFGGDYECVTLASALLAARFIARADVVIVCQGPGNAGTGTRFGFSGIEQGQNLDLVSHLQGTAIGVLRLSLAEKRPRHYGLSHHSITALGLLAHAPGVIAFPKRPKQVTPAEYDALRQQVAQSPIAARHTLETASGAPALALLAAQNVRVTSMNRPPAADPLFFHAAAAAGVLAVRHLTL